MSTPRFTRARRVLALVLALAAAGAGGGCGRKLPPSPPNVYPPAAVADLSAAVEDGRVILSWSVPAPQEQKHSRSTVFKIFRARQPASEPECSTCPMRFALVGELSARSKAPGSRMRFSEPLEPGYRHRYKVVAASEENLISKDSNVAGVEY